MTPEMARSSSAFNFRAKDWARKGVRCESPRSQSPESTLLRSAYQRFLLYPPCSAASFEVNTEPHTGARPSVCLCVGLNADRISCIPEHRSLYFTAMLCVLVRASSTGNILRAKTKSAAAFLTAQRRHGRQPWPGQWLLQEKRLKIWGKYSSGGSMYEGLLGASRTCELKPRFFQWLLSTR
jgi:hypothetical protein